MLYIKLLRSFCKNVKTNNIYLHVEQGGEIRSLSVTVKCQSVTWTDGLRPVHL